MHTLSYRKAEPFESSEEKEELFFFLFAFFLDLFLFYFLNC